MSLPPICAILAVILYLVRAGDGCLFLPSVSSLLSSCTLLEQEMDVSLPPICAILAFILYPARAGDGLSLPPVCAILAFILYLPRAGDGLVSPSHLCHPCFHRVPCESRKCACSCSFLFIPISLLPIWVVAWSTHIVLLLSWCVVLFPGSSVLVPSAPIT